MAWWLRSPGISATSPAYLASNGDVGNRAHEMTETIIGVRPAIRVKKTAVASASPLPAAAKALYDALHGMDEKTRDSLLDATLTATGIVTYIGRDIHGLPSFRLSDTEGGKCYVHACLASASEYGCVKVGDTVTVQGTFHILSNDWGVTLKGSRIQG